ncbi:DNA-binding death effector domain-containing protein 2 isoform X2 [Phalacrocorax carbo]|uniref:DNA-binding death effector domain-containing protein 2 isoform X2 n=1 Tax=Phalacrocorax carbo TaxID=9209 RepID=UPI00311A3CE6
MSRPPAPWEEEECLEYYGMVSLHRLFEVVGAQLTPSDVAVLSFLLDEAHPPSHPLDPSLWGGEDAPAPLLERWRRRRPRRRSGDAEEGRARPRDGVELLLELERRGLCDEGNFRHLLQLLRVVTRHDLLHCVTLKRPRTGSSSGKRKRTSRGRTRPPLPRRPAPPPHQDPPAKVTCDIRLRVRAEYCEHEQALRRGVASRRPRGPGRQLDVFGQASGVLTARDLGSLLCGITFSELSYLDAFWGDYLSGSLLEALKGVFLTEGLRRAVGREDVRLLVSVDQDDYEEGRRLLLLAAQRDRPPLPRRGGRGAPRPSPPRP